MSTVKKAQVESVKSKLQERDILTEMFEHFGIKVIEVNAQIPKPNKKKKKLK